MSLMLLRRFLLLLLLMSQANVASANECVVLLHGLARTSSAMAKLADNLAEDDYAVANVGYPSRHHQVDVLSELALADGLQQCQDMDASPVSIVTHSLGGILVRDYLQKNSLETLHRVVMLGPPNQGSEVVDSLKNVPGFRLFNGPAGIQLGTSEEDVPFLLEDVDFDLGIIAGSRTINPILSQFLPNPDDGKVSVARARVDGMCAFLVLPVSHAMMMKNDTVIEQVKAFLENGEFSSEGAENGLCEDGGR